MDLRIELDSEGRIWMSAPDGMAPEEAWLHGADDTPLALRASGLCPLEEKYTPGGGDDLCCDLLLAYLVGASRCRSAPWNFWRAMSNAL